MAAKAKPSPPDKFLKEHRRIKNGIQGEAISPEDGAAILNQLNELKRLVRELKQNLAEEASSGESAPVAVQPGTAPVPMKS